MSDTRQRIVQATLELMADHGMSGVTMSAVAESAGVARQTLYNHFPNVDTIVAEALAAHQTGTADELRVMLATYAEPADQLAHLVRHVAASAAQHAPLPMFRDGLSADVRATLDEHDVALRAVVADVLQAGAAAGTFRPDLDPDRDAHLIHAMLDGVSTMAAAEPDATADIIAAATPTLLAAVGFQD